MPFIERDGRGIHYEVFGDGPPVLLAHSFLCSMAMWAPQIEALKADHRVVAVDARGHGASGPAHDGFSMWDAADDHVAVLDALEVDKAHWAGLSMGGMAGLRAALRYPDRIASLMLVDSTGSAQTWFVRTKYRAMSVVATLAGVKPLLPAVLPLMFGATARREQPELVQGWASRFLDLDVPSMIRGIDAIRLRDELGPRLSEIRCPAIVIVGLEDKALPPSLSRKLAAGLGCACVEIPGCGHLSAQEQPEQVTAAMKAFLAGQAG